MDKFALIQEQKVARNSWAPTDCGSFSGRLDGDARAQPES